MEDCREYNGVTRAKVEELREGVRRLGGTPPDGDEGVVEVGGIKISLRYRAAEETLKVCILDKPMFVPASLVWGQVESSLK